ncbi:hypothetical protein BDV96DRAFT_693458 [Lophiotrema nucula]|uniref:Uncharacterized protein n=1 Tax=Lophiotrema nucula TaxID=690887 RepID=A0A6A5YK17_9PLEO|nr:hypothetical protein BDV96DRAFT_693458 [Lophiotrema nucula]
MAPPSAMEELAALMEAGDPFASYTGFNTDSISGSVECEPSRNSDDACVTSKAALAASESASDSEQTAVSSNDASDFPERNPISMVTGTTEDTKTAHMEQELMVRDVTIQALKMDNQNMASLVEELGAKIQDLAAESRNAAKLQNKSKHLEKEIQEMRQQLSTFNLQRSQFDEANKIQEEKNALEHANQQRLEKIETLKQQIRVLRAQSWAKDKQLEAKDNAMKKQDLQPSAELFDLKITNQKLQSEIATLTAEKREDQDEKKKLVSERNFHQAKCENLAFEVESLNGERTSLRAHRQLLIEQHQQMMKEKQGSVVGRGTYEHDSGELRNELERLKAILKDTTKNDKNAKEAMAVALTQLDLLSFGCQIFTCYHKNLSKVGKSKNMSVNKPYAKLATDQMLRRIIWDDDFIAEYYTARTWYIEHHRAHEAAGQYGAILSSDLTRKFQSVDQKRGVAHYDY